MTDSIARMQSARYISCPILSLGVNVVTPDASTDLSYHPWRGAIAGVISAFVAVFISASWLMSPKGLVTEFYDSETLFLLAIGLGVGLPVGAIVGELYSRRQRATRPSYVRCAVIGAGATTLSVVAAMAVIAMGLYPETLWTAVQLGALPGAVGGVVWRFVWASHRTAQLGRIVKTPVLLLLGWIGAWVVFGLLPSVDGPEYVRVSGQVQRADTYDSSFIPPGYYVECGSDGNRIYLPTEAAEYLGDHVHVRGPAGARCWGSHHACYLSIDGLDEHGAIKRTTPEPRRTPTTADAHSAMSNDAMAATPTDGSPVRDSQAYPRQ